MRLGPATNADAPDGRQRLGSYGSDDGFSPLFEVVETIHVEDEDVTDITINLPVSSVSRWYRLDGVVLGPEGDVPIVLIPDQ